MSKIGNYVLEKVEDGTLEYDDSKHEYLPPDTFTLVEQIEYLEWQIRSSQSTLRALLNEYNTTQGEKDEM